MSNHTPAPWSFRDKPYRMNALGCSVAVGPHPHDIIDVGASGGPDDVREVDVANARLIAAAPDLLAAVKMALACERGDDDHDFAAMRKMLVDSVAKAEGNQP